MSLDTKVKNLIINTNMTKEQYESVDDKSNQLFFVEDSSVVDVPAPEENQSGYLHTDGVNLTWKEIESGGDYLPLSGGELNPSCSIIFSGYKGGAKYSLKVNSTDWLGVDGGFAAQGIYPYNSNGCNLGESIYCWDTLYAKKINTGGDNSEQKYLIIPEKNGTLARLEDIPEGTQLETIPEASTDNVGKIIQYIGETNDTYTNGYFYNYVQSVTSIATGRIIGLDAVITVDTEKFLAQNPVLVEGLGPYPSMRGDYNGSAWDIWSQDPNITISKEDLVNVWGVTITNPDGTPYEPNAGDSFGLYLEESSTYGWQQIDVQPSSGGSALPDQTDNAGKFLMTDGTTASWSGKPLVNNADNESSNPYAKLSIGGNSNLSTAAWYTAVGNGAYVSSDGGIAIGGTWEEKGLYAAHAGGPSSISIGYDCEAVGSDSIAIGEAAYANESHSIAIGAYAEATATNAIAIGGYSGGAARAKATAECAIQLGCSTDLGKDCINSDANTFKVANSNGNFEIMSADGTIPTDRYSITPTDAGTYVPKLTIAEDGTATREWGTESGGAGGDYLPLSGGTMTGMLYLGEEQVGLFGENLGTLSLYKYNLINKSYYKVMEIGVNGIAPTAGKQRIGSSLQSYENVYTKSINNGADIAVPATGGTMVVATPPTDNGTYVLKATVVDGVVTTEWVLEA